MGYIRGEDKSWKPAFSKEGLTAAVDDNLRSLGVEALDIVNLRWGSSHEPSDAPLAEPFSVLTELKAQGKIRHLGLSNVTAKQVGKRRRSLQSYVCRTNTTWQSVRMTR